MTSDEVAEFEQNPNAEAIVKLRYLDDEGKVAGLKTPPFSHFAPMVQRVVDAHCGTSASA